MTILSGKRILLVISGGIAAYKSLELIRLLRKAQCEVRCILTKGGAEFITPLSVSALSEHPVYSDLFSLKDESEMGHIRLSREADLIVVAPASANLLARLANGIADDLASTTLLASNKEIMIAPAMNPEMWAKPATQRNVETLRQDGVMFIGPATGEMACGETGLGRMVEADDILTSIKHYFLASAPLSGKSVLVTSGPTYEPIDPVRFIGNRSSGKQGHAIADALAHAGAKVTLVTGPVALPDPLGVTTIHVETASEMLAACQSALPADIAVCAAAVADWRITSPAEHKMKKRAGAEPPALSFTENPDILAEICRSGKRPSLVIGFAAETDDAVKSAQEKLVRKGCNWILANQVGKTENPVFGTDYNQVTLVSRSNCDEWPPLSKKEVAARLVEAMISHFNDTGLDQDDQPSRRPSTASR
ncbi:MAG: bifunctional phosphopantothenoylcysteine decarboxylase/phosphopantothenate--cysteine ligase CoaBC [Alphaproteobacteria bacterium]|nr:bifunctional phosphopantothenoylcysteine decarboxylase/phosphopantothenate--cysteine ligase CoaBC [Alphaproteobacteria bacterium]